MTPVSSVVSILPPEMLSPCLTDIQNLFSLLQSVLKRLQTPQV